MFAPKPGFKRIKRNVEGLQRFFIDCAGLAAVEFALIFPLMIAFYFGAIETSHMLTANRRVTSVAYSAADITAQAISVSNSDMSDIFAASSAILRPFSTTPLSIRRFGRREQGRMERQLSGDRPSGRSYRGPSGRTHQPRHERHHGRGHLPVFLSDQQDRDGTGDLHRHRLSETPPRLSGRPDKLISSPRIRPIREFNPH